VGSAAFPALKAVVAERVPEVSKRQDISSHQLPQCNSADSGFLCDRAGMRRQETNPVEHVSRGGLRQLGRCTVGSCAAVAVFTPLPIYCRYAAAGPRVLDRMIYMQGCTSSGRQVSYRVSECLSFLSEALAFCHLSDF